MVLSRIITLTALLCLPLTSLAEIHLGSAWIRALPPTQPVTAAYVEVMNHGDTSVSVRAASVEGAGRVEIHTTREVDGMVTMEQLDELVIAPGQTLSLAPGGAHLMLFDMQAMPKPGESRELCLELASGVTTCTNAEVRKDKASGGHEHHHHH